MTLTTPSLGRETTGLVRPDESGDLAGGGRPPAPAAEAHPAVERVELVGRTATGRRARVPRSIERLAGVFVLVAVWELASATGLVAADTLAGPGEVARSAWHLLADGTLTSAIWASAQRAMFGLAIGVAVATVLALVAGLSRVGEDLVDTPMQVLRFLPIIGLSSLVILWFGIGDTSKVALIAFGAAFPLYINTSAAIRGIDPAYLELAQVLGLGRWARIRRVILPGAMPGFLTGLRLAVAVSWLLLVFVEQINATNGIGYLMIRAQTFFQTDVILVALVVYAVLGLVSDGVVRLLERRLLRWRPAR
jgi:sulfonate transport system permease protein